MAMHLNLSEWSRPFAVLLIGLMLSMIACSFVRDWEESHNLKEITYRSESRLVAFKGAVEAAFRTALNVRSAILHELVIEAGDKLDEDEFISIARSYSSFEELSALKNIAWVSKSHQEDQDKFNYQVVYSIYDSSFGVHPGVDLAANPSHREHISMAALSGEIMADMHLDGDSHQVISLFVPVFNAIGIAPDRLSEDNLLGIVYTEWDVGDLLESSSAKLPVSGLDFYLRDITSSDEDTMLYTHFSRSRADSDEVELFDPVWSESFLMAEHLWQLSSAPSPEFVKSHPIVLAWIVIFSGILFSLLVAGYVWRVSVRSNMIEQEVLFRTSEVRHSQQSLEEAQRIAHLGGWEWMIEGNHLIWSDEVYRIFGFEPHAFSPSYNRFLNMVHPDDRDRLEKAVNEALEGKPYSLVHRIILPDGGTRSVHEQGRVEVDDQDRPIRMVGTVQDITEQRRAERRLHRLAMALAETAESVVITNKEGVIRYVNHAFEKMSGFESDEVLGKTPNMVKSGEHSDEYYEALWKKITSGEAWFGTFTNRNKQGEKYIVEQTISPIHDMRGDVTGYVAVQRDVTDEREQRAKMEHTQRLESLGILAGGIAHDFNNLLTAIMGNASLARMNRGRDDLDKHLRRIEMAGEHAAELCRQMLAYSGQGDYVREWFSLNTRIHDMNELMQVSLNKNVRLTMNLEANECVVYGDKSQIQQVVMNLVINASEAIEETDSDGEIKLSTFHVQMSESDLGQCIHQEGAELDAGSYFCLTVSDNGCGMNEETRLKLFDPFFTTKFTGRGLGTSAMLGIVHSHHGALSVETEEGVGTTFRVYLPCQISEVLEGPATTAEAMKETVDLAGRNILVIDDEAYILDIVGLMLHEIGCKTMQATSATQGIEIYAKHCDQISLIILDMTMPEMDGLSCASKLLEINPNAVIVISSGYSKEQFAERVDDLNIAGFLQKPYSQDELYTIVKKLS